MVSLLPEAAQAPWEVLAQTHPARFVRDSPPHGIRGRRSGLACVGVSRRLSFAPTVTLGRVIGGKYRLLHVLGSGGMGTVWLAQHLDLASNVAIKFIDPRLLDDWRAVERFAREARAAAALRGANVVQVLDHGTYERSPYIVMELLEGETLASRLARTEQLLPAEVVSVVAQVARGVARAHDLGMVHRDLKPANVFLVDDGDTFVAKVLDFGIVKALHPMDGPDPLTITDSGSLLGTLEYMSPEQIQGDTVDASVDLWALGVVACECLTGVRPFSASKPGDVIKLVCSRPLPVPSHFAVVPAGFDAWFARAVNRDPRERFTSARELASALTEVLAAAPPEKCSRTAEGDIRRQRSARPHVTAFSTHREPRLRSEDRISSSLPAAINNRRDLEHIALVVNVSRTGALLWTRFRCEPGEEISLTLHFEDEFHGYDAQAIVVRIKERTIGSSELWHFAVAVRFTAPLTGIDAQIRRLREG